MIKVLVFDIGGAAEMVGRYIETELPVVVECMDGKCMSREAVELKLAQKICYFDVIVIVSPTVFMMMGEYLKKKYPALKIIFYGEMLIRVIKRYKTVKLLTEPAARKTYVYQDQKAACQEVEVAELDYEKWKEATREEIFMPRAKVADEMERIVGDKIIINSSEMLLRIERLKRAISWRAEIVDMRPEIVAEIKSYYQMRDTVGRTRVVINTALY